MPDQKTKIVPTAETSLAKIEKVKREIAGAIRQTIQASLDGCDMDLLIQGLGKKCSRYCSLKDEHGKRWNEDGTPKSQLEGGVQ